MSKIANFSHLWWVLCSFWRRSYKRGFKLWFTCSYCWRGMHLYGSKLSGVWEPHSWSVIAPVLDTACLLPLSVIYCVSLTHWLAAVNMRPIQPPEPEGTKALLEPLLAQQRARGAGGSPKLSLWKESVCVCVTEVVDTGSVCCFTSAPSHLSRLLLCF